MRISGRIPGIVHTLLDKVHSTGHMDVMRDLAYPLPATVIAEILGIPATDLARFKHWIDASTAMLLRDEELQPSASDEPGARMPS